MEKKKTPVAVAIPENTIESGSSRFWIDENGLVLVWNKPKPVHTLEDALENIGILRKISGNISRRLLIDMTQTKSMEREAREAYAREGSAGYVIAIALVTNSVMGRIAANFFLTFNKPGAPTRLFNNVESAKSWLATINV